MARNAPTTGRAASGWRRPCRASRNSWIPGASSGPPVPSPAPGGGWKAVLNACFARFLVVALALTTLGAAPRTPLGEKLDAHMSRLEAYGFSGSLLVAKGGEVILDKGYGFADAQRKAPFTAETAFDVGSITKQFTASAILKLEMQGKLAVSDPISKWFEGVPDDKRGITLHHLLTHSAGLVDILGDDYDEMPRDRLVKGALGSKLLWAPGTRYQYSNV